MTAFTPITPSFAIAGQLTAADFPAAAAAGYTLVINNRPDGEQPGQLTAAEGHAAATAAGLAYAHIPFQGPPGEETLKAMAASLSAATGPVLAHCRSGQRSLIAWALSAAALGVHAPQAIIDAAKAAGFDLSGMGADLARRSGG